MKRRELKKSINYLSGELLAECLAAVSYNKNTHVEDVESVVGSILQMQNEMLMRLSHVEPGSTKLFFKKMKDDIASRTEEIVAQIKELA